MNLAQLGAAPQEFVVRLQSGKSTVTIDSWTPGAGAAEVCAAQARPTRLHGQHEQSCLLEVLLI